MLNDENLRWYHIAVCKNMPINWFYDDYEGDEDFAKTVDDICKSCPVRAFCLREGIEKNETGVWGGVWLNRGRAEPGRNLHKTPDDWNEIKELINGID